MGLLRTAILLLGAAALAAGCGDDSGEAEGESEPTIPQGTTTLVTTTTVTVTTTTGDTTTDSSEGEELSFAGFKSPSGNIGCVVALGGGAEAHMRCTVSELASQPPPRPAGCEFDWGNYFELDPTGPGAWACVSDAMVPDEGFVTLDYGNVWSRGPFTCRARPAGVRCTNPEGHGLFLSRQRQRVF